MNTTLLKQYMIYIEKFNAEVKKAGGAGFTIEQLENMTGLDLLMVLAPNDLVICNKRGIR